MCILSRCGHVLVTLIQIMYTNVEYSNSELLYYVIMNLKTEYLLKTDQKLNLKTALCKLALLFVLAICELCMMLAIVSY